MDDQPHNDSTPAAPPNRPGKLAGIGARLLLFGVLMLGGSLGTCSAEPGQQRDPRLIIAAFFVGVIGLALTVIGFGCGISGLVGMALKDSEKRDK